MKRCQMTQINTIHKPRKKNVHYSLEMKCKNASQYSMLTKHGIWWYLEPWSAVSSQPLACQRWFLSRTYSRDKHSFFQPALKHIRNQWAVWNTRISRDKVLDGCLVIFLQTTKWSVRNYNGLAKKYKGTLSGNRN